MAAVVQRDGKYLVCRRPLHKRHGGMWEFPGGKLASGESYFQAARRELREELDVVVVSVLAPTFSVDDVGSEFLVEFVPTVINGEPQRIEHSELAWMSIEELLAVDLAPSDRRFVEFLATDRKPPDRNS